MAYLRSQIASGEWPVNSKIPTENELAEILGVGRTTIREAVRSLAALGMLEPAVGRGTFVRSRTPVSSVLADLISEFSLTEILGYRRALEVEAAQLAARHRTASDVAALRRAHEADVSSSSGGDSRVERGTVPGEFHSRLFEATSNRLLASLYAGVSAALRSAIARGEVVHGSDAELRRGDHAAILHAVEEGDVARAAHLMAEHADRDLQTSTGQFPLPPDDTAGTTASPEPREAASFR